MAKIDRCLTNSWTISTNFLDEERDSQRKISGTRSEWSRKEIAKNHVTRSNEASILAKSFVSYMRFGYVRIPYDVPKIPLSLTLREKLLPATKRKRWE